MLDHVYTICLYKRKWKLLLVVKKRNMVQQKNQTHSMGEEEFFTLGNEGGQVYDGPLPARCFESGFS